MTVDTKVRVGLFLVAVALPAFASAHGLYLGPLDGIGGTTP